MRREGGLPISGRPQNVSFLKEFWPNLFKLNLKIMFGFDIYYKNDEIIQ